MVPLSGVARISTLLVARLGKSLIISAMVATSLQLGLARGWMATWVNHLDSFREDESFFLYRRFFPPPSSSSSSCFFSDEALS